MLQKIMCGFTAPISRFKANPNAVLAAADGEAVAVSSHNEIQFYAVPAHLYERMVEFIETTAKRPPKTERESLAKVPAREINTAFLAAQIAGSCRIEGIEVTPADEAMMRDVIDGKVDVDHQVQRIVDEYQARSR